MGKYRLPLKMPMKTCLRHLLFLVIPNARDSCFHYKGPECPIHSTQKALRSIQPLRPALVMPGQCRQGTPQSDSFYFARMNMAVGLGPATSQHKDNTQWLGMMPSFKGSRVHLREGETDLPDGQALPLPLYTNINFILPRKCQNPILPRKKRSGACFQKGGPLH